MLYAIEYLILVFKKNIKEPLEDLQISSITQRRANIWLLLLPELLSALLPSQWKSINHQCHAHLGFLNPHVPQSLKETRTSVCPGGLISADAGNVTKRKRKSLCVMENQIYCDEVSPPSVSKP